jgi:4-hydroxy-3-methylbut-2-enyl diphosphate reductase
MPAEPGPDPAAESTSARRFCVLVFDERNTLALRRPAAGAALQLPIVGATDDDAGRAAERAAAAFLPGAGRPAAAARAAAGGEPGPLEVYWCVCDGEGPALPGIEWASLNEARSAAAQSTHPEAVRLRRVLEAIAPHVIRIPYLGFSENEYVFRFRGEEQRNRAIYAADERGRALYQSALCEAIKAVKRRRERTAEAPATLDFGAVRYRLPSHFGFCLGVQNAIERAYETIAGNPGRRIFMISELIHNPFVNEDLRQRGLIYLQSDRGELHRNPATGLPWWEELAKGDIVLTPAFGATDEDKVRLIERGIAIVRHDATCMLVEKVWKAARRFAAAGYTVVIHGKHEHEETRATFSNCAKYGPAIVIRDRREAEALCGVILAGDPREKGRAFSAFVGRHTPGFDPGRDLGRLAVVNQTTLLRNETLAIIDLLQGAMQRRFGAAAAAEHLHPDSRGDTLCYATQVNQDALERAIAAGADAAVVVGGRNSSNTHQLFRICEARFGERAFYVQSERDILARGRILHTVYPAKPGGGTVERPFLPAGAAPPTVLVTGGASCPDGIIQQVVARINGFFPPASLRPIEEVLASLGGS